jgi:AcrR family transcriptional regulator
MVYRATAKTEMKKAARRARLLAAARRLFARQGYHATTVPQVVNQAQSSIGSFYFYFRDKENVFGAVLEEFGARLAAALNEAIGRQGPIVEQMRAAVEALMTFLADNPDEARILIVESSGLGGRLEAIRRGIVSSHVLGVQRALEALGLPGIDPAVAARCWVGAVYEAVYAWLESPPADRMAAQRLARIVADFNLRGVGAPSSIGGAR